MVPQNYLEEVDPIILPDLEGKYYFRFLEQQHLNVAKPINNLVKCVQQNHVEIDGLVLEPLASGEAVLTDMERQMGVVLADIGGGTTDIAIFENNPEFTKANVNIYISSLSNLILILTQLDDTDNFTFYLNELRTVPKRFKIAHRYVEFMVFDLSFNEELDYYFNWINTIMCLFIESYLLLGHQFLNGLVDKLRFYRNLYLPCKTFL